MASRLWTTVLASTALVSFLASSPALAAFGDRVLFQGIQDTPDVSILQAELIRLGFLSGTPDGVFGPYTAQAVEAFQRSQGLSPDGIVGPATYAALRRALGGTSRGGFARGQAYVVQPGDTLSALAARFGVSVAAIMAANNLTDPTNLTAGQTILIPAPGSGSSSGTTYVVQSGDTLSSIAARFQTTVAALMAANHLSDANVLSAGETLVIPSGSAAAPPPSSGASQGVAPPSTPATVSYTVQPGDTLFGIAQHFHVSLSALLDANHLSPTSVIVPGQVLTVPVGSPGTASLSLGQELAATAEQFLGVPYVYGGSSPAGFDCSGLVQYVARLHGISLPRTSQEQYTVGVPVAEADLQPGDLVFFNTEGYASHVGIYIGNGQFVTAPSTGQSVEIQSLSDPYWASSYLGARRITGGN